MQSNNTETFFLCSSATQLAVYVYLYRNQSYNNYKKIKPSNITVFVCNPYCNNEARSRIYKYSMLLGFNIVYDIDELHSKQKRRKINLISRKKPSNFELNKILKIFNVKRHIVIEDGIGDYINNQPIHKNTASYLFNLWLYSLIKTSVLCIKLIKMNPVSIYYLMTKIGVVKKIELPLIAADELSANADIFKSIYHNIANNSYDDKFDLIVLGSLYSEKYDQHKMIAKTIYSKFNDWIIERGYALDRVLYIQHPRSDVDLEDYVFNKFGWVPNNKKYSTAEEAICANTKSTVLSTCSTSQVYALNILKMPCVTVKDKSILKHSSFHNCSNYLKSLGVTQVELTYK
jgi:hypothetical protein